MEKNSMTDGCALMIIGGSAGSMDVILNLLSALQPGLSFPVIIVVHRKNFENNILPGLFASRTKIKVKEAEEKDLLEAGCIYIAPADYHLLVEKDGTLSLDFSEKVNYSRPSIDVTFETAAEAFKDRLACLLLSGASTDGTKGLKRVKHFGGLVMVQTPSTSEVAYMPEKAIANVKVDCILDPEQMPEMINSLAKKKRL